MRCLVAFLAALLVATATRAAPSDELAALFSDYWATTLREDPFLATYAGVADYNRLVPAVAPADHRRRMAAAEGFAKRLDAIALDGVSETERVSAGILRFILEHELALAGFDAWRQPFLSDSGFHTAMNDAARTTPFRTRADYEDYIARLEALPAFLDQNVANMRQGLEDGFTQPREILPYVLPSFEAQVTGVAADHPLHAPFAKIPDSIPPLERARLERDGARVLQQKVIPAFERVFAFMKDEYVPRARASLGVSSAPGGEAYYAALVRYYTTLDDATPESVHDLGLKEVARIRAEMEAVMKQAGFTGTFAEFQAFLRTDEQFYAKTPDALLKEAAWIAKSIDGKLPAYFGKLPRQPYSVQPVPADVAPNYTTGRYSGAPPDGDRGGEYWVNTHALDKRPLYELPALTLHEAVPGHHLQIALAYEIEAAPAFREQFYPHAFGEGWALYAEKLGVEMGVYKTPYDEFGRLSYEMWRASRLVIDTGIHAKGWTRQQAIDYLAGNTALSLHNVQTEVDRYISWPGQALAYKMGELAIWELRAKAEAALGERFDIRDFHDAVLTEGGLPLEILRARIDAYIAREKAAP
jgi:uncharacterized protein (DUF885 family)